MTHLGRRLAKLEDSLPAVEPGRGFFIVGSDSEADTIREQFARAGKPEPACLVTGIERDRPLWLPAPDEPGAVKALEAVSDAELTAMLDIVQAAAAVNALGAGA